MLQITLYNKNKNYFLLLKSIQGMFYEKKLGNNTNSAVMRLYKPFHITETTTDTYIMINVYHITIRH